MWSGLGFLEDMILCNLGRKGSKMHNTRCRLGFGPSGIAAPKFHCWTVLLRLGYRIVLRKILLLSFCVIFLSSCWIAVQNQSKSQFFIRWKLPKNRNNVSKWKKDGKFGRTACCQTDKRSKGEKLNQISWLMILVPIATQMPKPHNLSVNERVGKQVSFLYVSSSPSKNFISPEWY